MRSNKKLLHYGALVSIIIPENQGMFLYSDGFIKNNIRAESFTYGETDFYGCLFLITPKYETKMLTQMNKQNIQDDYSQINQKNFDLLVRELETNDMIFQKNKGKSISYGEEFQLLHFKSRKFLSINQDSQSGELQNNYTLRLSEISNEKTLFKVGAAFKHQSDSSKVVKFEDLIHFCCCPDREAFVYYVKKKEKASYNKIMIKSQKDMNQSQDITKPVNNQSYSDISSLYNEQQGDDQKYQFYVGYDKKCYFKLKYFSELEQNTNQIFFGDIFCINSYENSTFLQCLVTTKLPKTQHSLELQESQEPQRQSKIIAEKTQLIHNQNLKDILIVEREKSSNAILFFQEQNNFDYNSSLSLWKIEGKELHTGGFIYEGDLFRLKNIKNNMYLMVKSKEQIKSQELKKEFLERTKNIDYLDKRDKMEEHYPQNLVYLVSHIIQPSVYTQSGRDIFLIDQRQDDGTVNFQYTDEDTLFTFEKVSNQQVQTEGNNISPLKYEDFFRIKHFKTQQYFTEYIKKEIESGDDQGLEQLLRQKYFTIKMKPSVEKREVFKLYKSQHQEIWETTFMLSCIPVIRKRTNDLKNLKKYINKYQNTSDKQFDKFKQKIKNLNLCLKMLHEFCYDENERMQDMQLDVLSLEIGLINAKRQKLLKQYDLITDCARIIQEIDKTFYVKDVENNIEEIQETLILIYQFLIKASFNNPDNQLECAKYFPLMVEHIGLNVEAEKCIRYILADNIKLLQSVDQPLVKNRCFLGDEQEGQKQYSEFNRIINDLISNSKNQFQQNQNNNSMIEVISPTIKKQFFTLSQHFLRKFNKNSAKETQKQLKYDKIQLENEEILHYFNSIIKYNSIGLTYNQTEVAKIIIEGSFDQSQGAESYQQKLYPIRSTIHNQLTINIDGKDQEFEEYLIQNDDNKKYRKFLQIQLKLYANLCYGRNYECINKIREIISFKALKNYIEMFEKKIQNNQGDIDVLDNFSSSLYSIIYCTYLDKQPYIERKVPKLIYNYNISDFQRRSYYNIKERSHLAQQDNILLSKQQSSEKEVINKLNLEKADSFDQINSANNSPDQLLNLNQQNENQYNIDISFNNSFQQKRQNSLQRSFSKQSSEKFQIDQLKEVQINWLIDNVKNFLKSLNGKQNRRANLVVKVVRLIQKLYSFESITDTQVLKEIFEALIRLFRSQFSIKKQNKGNSEDQNNLESSQNHERRSKVLSEYSVQENVQNEKSEKVKKIVKKIPKIQDDQLLFYTQIKNLNEFIRLIDEEKSKDAKVKEEIIYNIQTKMAIMQIFKQYIDLRRENYLQSIIHFIIKILPEMQQSDERKIKEKLENEIDILMPSNNLPDEPFELKEKEDFDILGVTSKFASGLVTGITNNLKGAVGKVMGSEQKEYVLSESEKPSIQSLDLFLEKDDENNNKKNDYQKDVKSSQKFIWMLLNTFLNSSDYRLNCSILKILFFNFSQCRNLIRSVKQCQIIIDRTDKNEEKIAQDLEERVKDFNIQCEKSETWFIEINNKQNSETMKKVSDKLKDLNYMFFCKKLIKDQEGKLIYQQEEQKPENIIMSRQFMIRNLDAHNSVITLIKDSLKIFKSFKEFDGCIEQQVIYIKCFKFLQYFCIGGNKLNKKLLYNQIDFFMELLNYLELGQTDLIIEIYKDNYKAITEVNDTTINAVLKKIMHYDDFQVLLQGEKEQKISQGHLPKYVDFFYQICIFKQVPVQQNMHKIIIALQDLANLQDFLFMEKVVNKIQFRNQQEQSSLKSKDEYQFCFDKISVEQYGNNNIPFVYHSKVLELILLLLENSDQGAKYFVQKLKNLLPAKYLIREMTKKGDIFCSQDFPQFFCYTQIKRYCFKLFNIFYCNQEGLKEIQDMIKKMEFMNQFIYIELFKVSEALYRYFNIQESKLKVINFKKREKNSNISNFDIDNILGENIIYQNELDKMQEAKQREYNQLIPLLVQQYPYLKDASSKEKKYVKLSEYLNHLLNEVWPVISFLFKQIEEYKQAIEQSSYGGIQKEDFEQFKPYTQFKDWFLESVAILLMQSYNSCKNNDKVAVDIQKEVIIDEEVAGDFNRYIKSYQKDLGKSYEEIEIQQIFFAVKPKERLILNYQNQINYPSVETIINLPLQNILSSKNNNDQFVRKCLLNILINSKIKNKIVEERKKLIYCIQSIQNITENIDFLSLEFLLQKIIQYIPQCFQEFVKGHHKEDHSILIDILRFLHDFIFFSEEDQEVDQENKNTINFNEDDEDTIKNLKIQQETLGIQDLGDQKQDTRSRKNANDFTRKKHQNLMAKFNLPYILLETLCSDSNKVDYFQNHLCRKIFNSIIMLFIQLLDGGNLIVQEQLYSFFIKEENSEKFFEIIHQFLTLKILNRSSQKTTIFDQVEYELDHIDLVYRSKDKFVGILEILKLLQLICENHNSNLQNYMRHQIKSRNNYNLIQDVILVIDSQIRVLNNDNFKQININQQNIEVLCQAFETLTEFVQGPCKQNQLELAESPIIEIIAGILDLGLEKEKMGRGRRSTDIRNSQRHSSFSYLNNNQKQSQKYIYDENELKEQTQKKIINYLQQDVRSEYFKNLIQKKFNEANKQEDWMIQKAKYKSLITIESILEGNKVKKIVKKIEKGINTKLLNLNMLNTFNKFKVVNQKEIPYTEELFGRGDMEIDDIINQSDQIDKKDINLRYHCDKIIEIGFKCLILKHYYNNLNDESNYDKEENEGQKKQQQDVNDEDDEDEDEEQDFEDLMDDDDEDEPHNYYTSKVENNDNQTKANNGILKNKQLNSNKVQINHDNAHSYKENEEKQETEQPQQDSIDLYYENTELNKRPDQVFFQKYLIELEINYQGQLSKVYFPKPPIANSLNQALIKRFELDAKRESTKAKVQDLQQKSQLLISEMKYEYQFNNYLLKIIPKYQLLIKFLNLILKNKQKNKKNDDENEINEEQLNVDLLETFNFWSFIFTIIANLCIILVLEENHQMNAQNIGSFLNNSYLFDEDPYIKVFISFKQPDFIIVFYIFSIFAIIFQGLAFIIYWLKTNKFLLSEYVFNNQKIVKQEQRELKSKQDKLDEENEQIKLKIQRLYNNIFFWFQYKLIFWFNYEFKYSLYSRQPWIIPLFSYQCLQLSITILSIINPIPCALMLLLYIFTRYPELKNILQAIYKPRKQILLTVALLCLSTYFFSLLYYYNFYRDFDPYCVSIWKCFTFILVQTFVAEGGFLGVIFPDYTDDWGFSARIIADFAYVFFINILVTQILSGIIIDQFAQLRAETQQRQEDINTVCFICGQSVSELEKRKNKKGQSFRDHIEFEHSKWNYINFMQYLDSKKETDLSGFESYVNQKRQNHDITWFPIRQDEEEDKKRQEGDDINFDNIEQQIQLKKKKELGGLEQNWQLVSIKIEDINNRIIQVENELKKKTIKKKDD
ncbi:hypothetical protein ABPG72_009117 [Tetrahymena utriculariae]